MSTSQSITTPAPPAWGRAALYGLMLLAAVAGFLMICEIGHRYLSPATIAAVPATIAAAPTPPRAEPGQLLFHLLLALVTVIAAGQLLGQGFRLLGQPPVIGEVIAGIVLGPSLLGRVAPEAYAFLLPTSGGADIRPILGTIAQLGVILYMFVIGLELDSKQFRKQARAALAISHASIVAPFLLGALLALGIYRSLAPANVSFPLFALFLGVSLSITALPVLARILADRRMTQTPLGVMAITCSAIGDVSAWCLLAFVVGVAQAQVVGAVGVLLWSLVYLAAMLLLVRPLLHRWTQWLGQRPLSMPILAVILLGLLLSALATEWIGIHALFGAFVFGACIEHDSPLAKNVTRQIESIVLVLFLPAFFVFAGMRTEISLLSGLGGWLVCGIIILLATVGKFGGTLVAARIAGQTWRDSAALGALMNTRGLMELIVLNIGLDLKIISPTLFAMLVIMALVTTIATGPMLDLIARPRVAH